MSKYPSLFEKGLPDWHNNACLNWTDMSYGYIEGYLRAANLLVDHINEHGRDQDTLVYPIIFCYRHHLEIRMKEITKQGRNLLHGSGDYEDGHRLTPLWVNCKSILLQVYEEFETPDEIAMIHQFVEELDKIDAGSDGFRYWESSKGKKSKQVIPRKPSLRDLREVNIRHFKDCANAMAKFLEGASMGIGAYLQHQQE